MLTDFTCRTVGVLSLLVAWSPLSSCLTRQEASQFSALPFSEETVVEVEGSSRDELFSRASAWFENTVESMDSRDKDKGEILGRGVGRNPWLTTKYIFTYQIKISVEDGKARMVLWNFQVDNTEGDQPADRVSELSEFLAASFEAAMKYGVAHEG